MITGTLPLADAGNDRMGSAWDFISPTRLNLWLKCPLAYKLRYVDGIKTPTTPTLFLGKRVHDALEVLYRHRQLGIELGIDDLAKRIDESWEAAVDEEGVEFASVDDAERLKKQAVGLVRAYLDQVDDCQQEPLAVETWLEADLVDPMTGENLGIPLVGVVDLVFGGDDGSVICDFKTSARSTAPSEITHEIQLGCYAYLYRQLAGTAESGLEIRSLIKTKAPKVAIHSYPPRTDGHMRRLFAVIHSYLDDLHTGRFVFRPGLGCSFCDYREKHCAAWDGRL